MQRGMELLSLWPCWRVKEAQIASIIAFLTLVKGTATPVLKSYYLSTFGCPLFQHPWIKTTELPLWHFRKFCEGLMINLSFDLAVLLQQCIVMLLHSGAWGLKLKISALESLTSPLWQYPIDSLLCSFQVQHLPVCWPINHSDTAVVIKADSGAFCFWGWADWHNWQISASTSSSNAKTKLARIRKYDSDVHMKPFGKSLNCSVELDSLIGIGPVF